MDAAAWYATRSAPTTRTARSPTAAASACATCTARGVEPSTAAHTPVKSAPSGVTVISGCTLRPSRSPSTSNPDAPEQCPTSGPGATHPAAAAMASSGTHSSTSASPVPVYPRPCGPDTGTPAWRSAAPRAVPSRPPPTTAVGDGTAGRPAVPVSAAPDRTGRDPAAGTDTRAAAGRAGDGARHPAGIPEAAAGTRGADPAAGPGTDPAAARHPAASPPTTASRPRPAAPRVPGRPGSPGAPPVPPRGTRP